jgi:hypothetical protein
MRRLGCGPSTVAGRWAAGLALLLGMFALSGCGSGDGGGDAAVSAAEAELGAAMLPPDGMAAVADALGTDELPPDEAAVVADAELPPTS